VRAGTLARLGGHAPPTLHAVGARAVSGISKRIFNLVVTNGPGPQVPLYSAGARMLEMYPVVPLAAGQGLAIGITSYDGGVHYGLNGDRDALSDVDVLAQALDEALDELRTTSASTAVLTEKPPPGGVGFSDIGVPTEKPPPGGAGFSDMHGDGA
jgi:diacylglycerol O-acyltransferase